MEGEHAELAFGSARPAAVGMGMNRSLLHNMSAQPRTHIQKDDRDSILPVIHGTGDSIRSFVS